MKTILLSLFISLLTNAANAQEAEGARKKEHQDTLQKDRDTATAGDKSEINGEELDQLNEVKSFTLDPGDAVLEQKMVVKQPEQKVDHDSKASAVQRRKEQEKIRTLGGRNSHHGGFGALSFRASEFNEKDIVLAGFRGGWIINRAIAIGFEGYGVIPTAAYENIDPDSPWKSRSVGGYGGMFLEPIILSNKVVHLTFPVAGGAGWLGYVVDWEQNHYHYVHDLIDDDIYWYIEPGAAVELNVARNFRINMGATYRFTEDLELINTDPSAFEGWNYFLTLKFGRF